MVRRMRPYRLFATVIAAVALAGCGSGSSSGGGADPAAAIPADSVIYVEAAVRPEGDQGDNARELLDRFLGDKSLTDMLDEALADEPGKPTYDQDVKPWLGERAGVGVTDLGADEPSFTGAVAITDAGAAEKFISGQSQTQDKGDYKGAKLYFTDDTWVAVLDDYLAVADDEAGVKQAVDAADGDSLADSDQFEKALDNLPDERLGTFFADIQGIFDQAGKSGDLDPSEAAVLKQLLGDGDLDPITAALTAEPDSATIESYASGSGLARLSTFGLLGTGASTELVRDAPADSWAVFGAADVGDSIKQALETFGGAIGGAAISGQLESQTGINLDRDILSWVGDIAVYVKGDSVPTLGGALIIGVTDTDAAKAAIPKLVAAAKRQGAPVEAADVDGAEQAFAVPVPDAPGPAVLAQGGDRVVLALGEQAAAEGLKPGETIDDSGLYDKAKDSIDGLEPSLILSLPTVFKLVEESGDTDADYAKAKPYLDMLDLVVTGSKKDGDKLRSLFTVTAK